MHFATKVAILCIATSSAADAQILYKSVGPDGKVVYSDKPPASGKIDKTLDVQALPNTAIPPQTLKELEQLKRDGKVQTAAPGAGLVLFSASWCGYSRQAKAHLAQRAVSYREYDIDTPEGKAAFVQAGGGRGVPLLIKNGDRVRGYSREGYEALLALR